MEQLRELLNNAAKQEALELQLPLLRARKKECKETLTELKRDWDWAQINAKNLEEPGFFQRLLGNIADKQEKARAEVRKAAAAYEEAKRELEELEYQLENQEAVYASLSGSRERYDHARAAFVTTAHSDEIQQLSLTEIEIFRPVAIETVRQIRKSLYAARGWMEKNNQPRYFTQEGRRMEFMQLADDYAQKLQDLLVYFPEGSITLGASMSAPSDYIRSASMNLAQVDRVNIAIDQSLRVQEQIEAL